MDNNAIFKLCKEQGCCDRCCLRYLGIKNSSAYENSKEFALKYQDNEKHAMDIEMKTEKNETDNLKEDENSMENEMEKGKNKSSVKSETEENIGDSIVKIEDVRGNIDNTENCESEKEIAGDISNDTEKNNQEHSTVNNDCMEFTNGSSPPKKRKKVEYCVSCLGILQEETWPLTNRMVKEMMDKKRYECSTFACALSAPIATMLREHVISLRIAEVFSDYDSGILIPLKEAWKWSYGVQLERLVGKTLDSGAISPLLITVNYEYADEMQELEVLKLISPALFESRSKQRKRFTIEFTRRSCEQALEKATLAALRARGWGGPPRVGGAAACVAVGGAHSPLYLGGRYVKLSRSLPQTPWLVDGQRMMDSSVQEIIFGPVADIMGILPEEQESRMKLVSAGREDVDVRCGGEGRPFAIEISDPRRIPAKSELSRACDLISAGDQVLVKQLVIVQKEELAELKKGEQTKCKTYEALCIKLTHSKYEQKSPSEPIEVTAEDIARINSYRNTEGEGEVVVRVSQRTPIRVLHRRPLLTRTRDLYHVHAEAVPGHPQLFTVRVRSSAGTYVKEWAHGDLGRTSPCLGHALQARADILALDVTGVHLHWPRER